MFRREHRVVLDNDFQQIFKPFYYIQYIYCVHSFNIKQNWAYPITKFNFILAVLVNMLIVFLLYETIKHSNFWYQATTKISLLIYFQYLECFMLLTFLNFYQQKTNFQLIVKLQDVCQRIRNSEDTKRLKIISWFWCSVVVIYYICMVTMKLAREKQWYWTRGVFLATTVVFEIKLANMAVLLYFLVFKLRKWQKVFINRVNENESDKDVLDDMRFTLQEVISAYDLFKNAFQIIALFHFVMTFFQCLVYIEILIVTLKTDADIAANQVSGTGVISWIIKGIILELYLCVVCELFYSEIERTRDETTTKIGLKLSGLPKNNRNTELYRVGKCVRRILDNNFTKMTACGLFTVDIALLLGLGGVVTTYTLVLLQFAQ